MTTPPEIEQVLNQHPDLGLFGFGTEPTTTAHDFLEQVDTARRWLAGTTERTLLATRGSYKIKHLIERSQGRYVSNGAAIVAATLEGYTPVRKRPGPNCRFQRA